MHDAFKGDSFNWKAIRICHSRAGRVGSKTLPKYGESEMEIATGYFARAKSYVEQGYALVSIARVAPWFLAKECNVYPCECLAPSDEILSLKDKPDEYIPKYRREILGNLKAADVYHRLYMIARQENTDKVVLLCYEAPDKFCHRHLVAEWLENELGTIINEVHIEVKNNV